MRWLKAVGRTSNSWFTPHDFDTAKKDLLELTGRSTPEFNHSKDSPSETHNSVRVAYTRRWLFFGLPSNNRINVECQLEPTDGGVRVEVTTGPAPSDSIWFAILFTFLLWTAFEMGNAFVLTFALLMVPSMLWIQGAIAANELGTALGVVQVARFSGDGPPCPHCSRALFSERSKQCLNCHADWHNEEKSA